MAIIALSMRVNSGETYPEPRDAISHDWTNWLQDQGHLPLLVPNVLARPSDVLTAFRPSLLVLTGGNDAVGAGAGEGSVSGDRDRTEDTLLAAAVAARLPVMAVCRGLHVVNRHFGGVVRPGDCAERHAGTAHAVRLAAPFDVLAGRAELEVNSFHRQWVPLDGIARGLRLMAVHEPDGVVEGLVHSVHPILAVQWHPERGGGGEPLGRQLLSRLLVDGAFWTRN
jgi:putative glutamine amidotransferase